MNHSRVRVSSAFALLLSLLACAVAAPAQDRAPNLWFQGTRLILEHPVAMSGDVGVATRDAGMRTFLQRLGATVAYQPQQRYVVVTAEDRRTIVFTLGDPSYTIAGVRARAPFAPFLDNGDPVLPFYALARALYVEPVEDVEATVLQPRIGALDVRTDANRTVVTVRGAMPLLTTTQADTPERVQLAFAGLGSALAASRRAPGPRVEGIDVAVGGSTKVPVTTLTITAARGTTHRVVPSGSPDAYEIVFEAGSTAYAPQYAPPTPPPYAAETTPAPYAGPSAPAYGAPSTPAAGRAVVSDVAVDPGDNDALTVRLALNGSTTYAWHRLLDHRWYLDLANTTLAVPAHTEQPSFGAVRSVRVAQIATADGPAVRVAFTLTGDQPIALAGADGSLTLTVPASGGGDVARSGAGRVGDGALVANATGIAGGPVTPAPAETPWKYTPSPGGGGNTIVIDPGHGGADIGTAHNGLVEKTLTMDIAQRLRALLVAQGFTVRMTHEADIDPVSDTELARMRGDGKPNADDRAYLQTRCDVANDINARLFISIHINSAPVASARGTTFYWYKPQDAPFAQALERAVIPAAGTQDDGTRHENFYVVRHTTMPAVLIETAFITNPGDVSLLRQPSFLQNVAQGIASGVKSYLASPAGSAVSER